MHLVEQEVADVAILHDIIAADSLQFSGGADVALGLELFQILKVVDLGADEPLLKVGVDDARGLRGGGAHLHRPGTHLLHASGEIGLQAQQLVGLADQPVQAGFLQTQGLQELFLLGVVQHGEHIALADTPGDFANEIGALFENAERRRAFGQNARALVEKNFGWPSINAVFERYCRETVAAKRR